MKTDRGYPKEKAPSFTMRCEGLGWNPNWYPQPFVANYSKGGFQKYKNPTTESICVPWLFHMCNHWIQLVVARIFECVAACCSVMQCVAIDCRVMRVLHCAIMHGSVWQCIAAGHFECAAVWYSSVLQYVAVCLQCTVARYFDCVAVCCSVLQAMTPKGLFEIEANMRYDSFIHETLQYFEIKTAWWIWWLAGTHL